MSQSEVELRLQAHGLEIRSVASDNNQVQRAIMRAAGEWSEAVTGHRDAAADLIRSQREAIIRRITHASAVAFTREGGSTTYAQLRRHMLSECDDECCETLRQLAEVGVWPDFTELDEMDSNFGCACLFMLGLADLLSRPIAVLTRPRQKMLYDASVLVIRPKAPGETHVRDGIHRGVYSWIPFNELMAWLADSSARGEWHQRAVLISLARNSKREYARFRAIVERDEPAGQTQPRGRRTRMVAFALDEESFMANEHPAKRAARAAQVTATRGVKRTRDTERGAQGDEPDAAPMASAAAQEHAQKRGRTMHLELMAKPN